MINSLTNISDIAKEFGTTLTSKKYTYFYNNRNLESPIQPNNVNVKSWIGYDHNYREEEEVWGDWYDTQGYYCSGTTKYRMQERVSSKGNIDSRYVIWEYNSVTCGYVPPVEVWGDWYWIEQYQCSGTTRQKRQQRDSSFGNHDYKWSDIEYNSVTCGYVPPVEVWGDWYWIDRYMCQDTNTQLRQQQRDSSFGNHDYKWVVWDTQSIACGYIPPEPPTHYYCNNCGADLGTSEPQSGEQCWNCGFIQ